MKIFSEDKQKTASIKEKTVYNHQRVEKKWQRIWKKTRIYEISDKVKGKENFYTLIMYPYSSGNLHIGHWYNFAPADVFARFKKMQGYNVMFPIGFDAFGLPAENAAIRRRIHPKKWTYENIKNMRKQLKSMGAIFDWSREVVTCDPEYYRWTQWMFLQMYKNKMAYKARSKANWCPNCQSILADEQAEGGRCWRCEGEVEQREIEQWFFNIRKYAEDLLKDLEDLDWPEKTKIMQKNWIGKSEGWEIKFEIANCKLEIEVFTTRIDTLFGATYLVLAPEHPIIDNIKPQILNIKYVEQYIEKSKTKTELERISEVKEKTGVELKGVKAINPANKREIPIFVADYVLVHYGTGAIMGVPAHDQRDFDFAKLYNLPIIEVIKSSDTNKEKERRAVYEGGGFERAYEGEGILVNSSRFNGMFSGKAKEKIGKWLNVQEKAEKKIYYKMRDWLVSRQRYWGAPIPMIYCQKCGWQPVKEKDLPVLLPTIKDFLPSNEGKSPLAKAKKFVEIICPKCKGPAERETDTMDGFVCSSWYYLRYADPHNKNKFTAKEKLKKWLPVDQYIGGAEHTVMHLLYSRFFTKALKDFGFLDFKEPFLSLRHQGIILGPDGQKMSKSKGNVVDPDEQVAKDGADCVRTYLCFMGPYDQGGPWQMTGIIGIRRFFQKIWGLSQKVRLEKKSENKETEKLVHKTIKKVSEDIANFKFNTAISALMILLNHFHENAERISEKDFKIFLLLLTPFAPYLSEELWREKITKVALSHFKISNSIHTQSWPKFNPAIIQEERIQLIIQINGKMRDKIEAPADISEEEAKKLVLQREKIKKWLEGKKIKKIIFVPKRLLNIVI